MLQTLFFIPRELFGLPLFGWGLLLAAWLVGSCLFLGYLIFQRGRRGEAIGFLPTLLLGGAIIVFLLPALIDETGLPIRGYGAMLVVAVAAAMALAVRRARNWNVDPEIVFSLLLWMFIPGIVGARLFYVVEYWPKFARPSWGETLLEAANFPQGGLVVYGALVAAGVAFVAFVRIRKLPGLALGDLIAPSLALGLALGRVGCFLNGCCYGGATDLPWGVQFPLQSPPFLEQVQQGTIDLHGLFLPGKGIQPAVVRQVSPDSAAARAGVEPGDRIVSVGGAGVASVEEAQFQLLAFRRPGDEIVLGLAGRPAPTRWRLSPLVPRSRPIHPAQLYSSLDALLLAGFLLAYSPYRRRDGELLGWLLVLHPISRFLLEIVRVDESAVFNTGLSISQNISVGLLVLGLALWGYLWTRPVGLTFGPWNWPSASSVTARPRRAPPRPGQR